MSKISLLPNEPAVDGTETVVFVKAGATKRGPLNGLVNAAVAPHVASAVAAAAAANAGNINIIGEPGELVVNQAGYVVRRTVRDGSVDTGSAARDLANRQARGVAFAEALKRQYPTAPLSPIMTSRQDWLVHSQSLGVGSDSIPWFVDSVPYARMPNGGQRYAAEISEDTAVSFNSTVPMTSAVAEVGLQAAARMYAQILLEEKLVDLAASGHQINAASTGEGSRSISELAAAPLFNRVNAHWTAARAVGLAENRPTTPAMAFWVQGEKDYQVDTAQATYEAALAAMQVAIQASARTAFADPALVLPMITYQTATHISYARTIPKVALAQLAVARANPLIAMGPPAYFLPYGSVTSVHPLSLGYVWMFAHFGMTAARWQCHGVKPMPLASLQTRRQGRSIFIRYDVQPMRGLVLDGQTIGNQSNYGFTVVDAGGNPLGIAAVRIVGNGDVVELELTADVPANAEWRYAWTALDGVAGRGGLHDNSPIIFDRDDARLPMWMWAAIDRGIAA